MTRTMPNYYAHLKFGESVLEQLPEPLVSILRRERAAFDLGCQGPDPLFFYHVLHPSSIRREGLHIHRHSALPVLERVRESIESGRPRAVSYGTGFLTHLALDSACHAYIYQEIADGPVTHMAMELDFDRLLLERDGLDPWGHIYLPRDFEQEDWEAAAAVFRTASPRQMMVAYNAMDRYMNLLAHCHGKRRAYVIEAISRIPGCGRLRGITFREERGPDHERNGDALLQIAVKAEAETIRHVVDFFTAIRDGEPIPAWFDRDFRGDPAELPLGLAMREI